MLKPLSVSSVRETITVMEFRKRPGEALLHASLGKTIVVTKNGAPICMLVPYEMSALELGASIRQHYQKATI